mgnify:CR=1 FL=1|tara:strand:- start:2422 stop:3525 length:1104 start_codon:yes stop_codon:yes gene_type:complete
MPDTQQSPPEPSGQNRKVILGRGEKPVDRADRYPLLELVCDDLSRRLMRRLADVYGAPVQIELAGTAIERFGDYVEGITDPALFCVFDARQWPHSGLIVIDGDMVATNLQFLLGGGTSAAAEPEPRAETTQLDRTLARQFAEIVLSALSEAFRTARSEIGAIDLQCHRIETAWQFAAVARPQAPAFIVRLDLTAGEAGQSSQVDIMIPMQMLEPVRRYLTETYSGDQRSTDMDWARHMAKALMRHPLPIDADLERLSVPLDRVVRWQVGDVLPLAADANTPVELHICGTSGQETVLVGKLGALRGNRALKLLDNAAVRFGKPLDRLAHSLGIQPVKRDFTPSPKQDPVRPASDSIGVADLGLAHFKE